VIHINFFIKNVDLYYYHNIAEILLKVALSTTNQTIQHVSEITFKIVEKYNTKSICDQKTLKGLYRIVNIV